MTRFRFVLMNVLIAALAAHQAPAATITVDTTDRGITSGHCSLQEAMYSAEFGTNIALTNTFPTQSYTTGCAAGTGNGDTIVLQAGATYSFADFWHGDVVNYMGPTATPIIFKPMTIQGNGATLQWTGTGNARLFAVGSLPSSGQLALMVDGKTYSGGGSLTLQNVYVKGFRAHGGNGMSGGGGGLGAGGAIFVDHTALTVENSTFENNGAVGGNGSSYALTGGGGGGLSGNGGVGDGSGAAGGGGGGSRGNGGNGSLVSGESNGGGGGGTYYDGTSSNVTDIGGNGGAACGAQGGDGGLTSNDGRSAPCKGGGGGGGGGDSNQTVFGYGMGGNGNFGGGGGGSFDDGGTGGFGGGGGGSGGNGDGGNGGFGAGGGAGDFDIIDGHAGKGGGSFGTGNADESDGGGGNGLGGAIFSYWGTVVIENSTFYNNYVTRGVAGGGSADNGGDAGGAIFAVNGVLKVLYSTITGNQATGSLGGIAFYTWDDGFCGDSGCISYTNYLLLVNTIIANNGASECGIFGHPDDNLGSSSKGAGNLIMQNDSAGAACPGVVSTSDPQLQTLRINDPGNTPTMAILKSSPAADVGVTSSSDTDTPLPTTDQRGVSRPQPAGGSNDIGAYEARLPDFTFSTIPNTSLNIGGSGSVTVTVNSFEYFNGDVSLSIPSSSSGLTASITDPLIAVPTNSSGLSGVNFQLAPTVTPGSYTATVEGKATGWDQSQLTHTTTATVLVSATIGGMARVISAFTASGDINSSGIVTALNSKLNVAQNFIDSGDNQTAINVLGAFIYQVRAQSGKHISTAAANALIVDAQAVMTTVGSSLRPNPLMGSVLNSTGSGVLTTVSVFDSAKHLIATAATDSSGFYYFPLTRLLTQGAQYTMQVSVPKGYKKSSPALQTLTWSGNLVTLIPFVLN